MKTVKIIRLGKLRTGLFESISQANKESAKVWNFGKDKLQEAIKNKTTWPTIYSLHEETKGKFNLHSQSVQQVCRAFACCIETTRRLRKTNPEMKMKYPHKDKEFYPTVWTSQAAKVKDGLLSLPMGRDKRPIRLRVDLPDGGFPCRIVWRDGYELHVCQDKPVRETAPQKGLATIDLGEIHQAAVVTSDGKGLVVSGRGIRTIKHATQKMLKKTKRMLKRRTKNSRKWKQLNQSRHRQSERNRRRVKNLRHRGVRAVVEFLKKNKVGKVFVGDPDGVRRKDCGRNHNQRMSLWEYGTDIRYLKETTFSEGIEMLTGSERGTSSTCPVCGARRRQKGRQWACLKCGFTGHRDLVGATNMHLLAFGVPVVCPQRATYLRPGPIGTASSSRADMPRSSLAMRKVCDPPAERQGPVRDGTLALRQPETHPL
jgi:putative transposase